MESKKLIAIIAVVVIVVAGAAAAIVMTNGGGSKNSGKGTMTLLDSNIEGKLYAYGNVDGDMDIDADDKSALEKAIADGTTSKLWKYADANYDGAIDATDVTFIQSILDATTSAQVEVKHVQRYVDKNGVIQDYEGTSKYPIKNVMATGAGNMLQFLKQIDVVNEIVGIAWSSKVDFTLLSDYKFLFDDSDTYRIGTSAGNFNKDAVLKTKTNTGAATIISSDNYSYLAGKSGDDNVLKEQDVEDLGIDVIRVAPATTDFSKLVSDLALIQFFLGKSTDLKVLEGWYKSTITELNDKLNANVGEGKKYSVVNFANASASSYSKSSDGTIKTTDSISKNGSDYTAFGYAAGGSFALVNETNFSSRGNGGSWLNDYEIDKIVVCATGSTFSWYGGTASTDGKDLVTSRIMAYYLSEPFYNEEVYCLSGDMPTIMRVIYCAHIYYPQLFSKDWADNINKDYATKYCGLTAEQIDKGEFYFSMKDLGIKGH